ncbi:MAG: T9SS type A sorting domain-containing protein, partial [bacterium]|nr:T9SS type A sorting domain-containing protein [bacterium]
EASMGKINEVLLQSYPNPLTQFTVINYQLPVKSKVLLRVYNISGQLIRVLVNETKEAGYYSISWNSKGISAGIYFLKLEAGGKVINEKLVLVK